MKVWFWLIFSVFIISCNKTSTEERLFFDSGKLKFEVDLDADGLRTGQSRQYYENGNLRFVSTWKSGKKEGLSEEYFRNGNLKIQSMYSEGVLNGETLLYDSSGLLVEKLLYENDLKNGLCTLYYPNGTPQIVERYVDGECNGWGSKFYPTSELQGRVYCLGDSIVYFKAFTNNGEYYNSVLPIGLDYHTESEELEITLMMSAHDNVRIGVIIGPLDINKNLVDTVEVLGSSKMSVKYSIGKNENIITGKLYEIKMPEQTVVGDYHFEFIR